MEPQPYVFEVFWDDFPNFRYYSLKVVGAERSLASQALHELEADPLTQPLIARLLEVMEQIGYRCRNIREPGMLRTEIAARALPPESWRWRQLDYLREIGYVPDLPALRWYAYDADQHILLLFGAGLKTANDPTQCPQVEKLFRFADHASRYLDANAGKDGLWEVVGLTLRLADPAHPLYL